MPALAVRCYRRAVAHGDREGIGLAKLVGVRCTAQAELMMYHSILVGLDIVACRHAGVWE